jgi:DNA-binding NarL/FixJ family response regulator
MIQIVVVEDQEIVRRGLKTLLQRKPDFQVVGDAGNGQEAIALISALYGTAQQPDVILMDIQMPVLDGVAATQQICQQFPDAKVLILTTFDETPYITKALQAGAKGYVLKDTPSKELAEIIRSIHRGYTQFGPGILERAFTATIVQEHPGEPLDARPSEPASGEGASGQGASGQGTSGPVPAPPSASAPVELPPGFTELTSREREVLCLIAAGHSNREIAERLCVTEGTARNHISHILTRLNVRDRTQAAIVANAFLPWLENPEANSL